MGLANGLIGKYFHDSILNATLTDAVYSMEYLSLKMGAAITVGSNGITLESITTTAANEITVAGTPVELQGLGLVGWYALQGSDDWKKITFVGNKATVADLPMGTAVCVKYCADEDAARQFIVPTNIIPTELMMILQFPLFRAGDESLTQSYKVGTLEVKIPRFLPDPTLELSLTATGAATVSFSGTALPYKSSTGCQNDGGNYAIFTEIIDGADWTDGLTALAIDNADVQLNNGDSTTLQVWGIYGAAGNVSTKPIDNAKITFTSDKDSVATINNKGVVTAAGAGSAQIKAVATATAGKPNPIEAYAIVTVA